MRLFQLVFCFAIAGAVTASLFVSDGQRRRTEQGAFALNLAKQVASQAEGLAFAAKQHGEEDAIGWSVHLLSQGAESRVLHVSRFQGSFAATETHTWDGGGAFEYRKVFSPETGTGVKVVMKMPFTGFLGTRTKTESDMAVAVLFSGTWFLIFFATSWWVSLRRARVGTRRQIHEWAVEARLGLTDMGTYFRDVIRQSQKIARAAGKAYGNVAEVREKLHSGLNDLRVGKAVLAETEQVLAQTEVSSLNAVMEASRLGPEAKRLTEMNTELHRKIQRLRKALVAGVDSVRKLEIALEPTVTDADVAYDSFDGLGEIATEMQAHTKSTLESLMAQSKLVDGLNDSFGGGPIMSVATRERAESAAVAPADLPSSHHKPASTLPGSGTPRAASSRKRSKKPPVEAA